MSKMHIISIEEPDTRALCGRENVERSWPWAQDFTDAASKSTEAICHGCMTRYSNDAWKAYARKAGDRCLNCDREIKVSIFKGTGHCSDDCRKALGEDIT